MIIYFITIPVQHIRWHIYGVSGGGCSPSEFWLTTNLSPILQAPKCRVAVSNYPEKNIETRKIAVTGRGKELSHMENLL